MKIIIFLLFILPIPIYNSDIFTSSLRLCHLLKTEIDNLNDLEKQFKNDVNFNKLNIILENIRKEIPKSIFVQKSYDLDDCLDENSFISRFITNPINSYTLIYRFTKIWPDVYRIAKFLAPNSKIIENEIYIPQKELYGVRDAIYRLGVFYLLEPEFLKNGSLSSEWMPVTESWSPVPKHLTANEIFEIGKISFTKKDYYASKSWFMEALKEAENDPTEVNYELLINILDYLSWSE